MGNAIFTRSYLSHVSKKFEKNWFKACLIALIGSADKQGYAPFCMVLSAIFSVEVSTIKSLPMN